MVRLKGSGLQGEGQTLNPPRLRSCLGRRGALTLEIGTSDNALESLETQVPLNPLGLQTDHLTFLRVGAFLLLENHA